MVVGHFDCVDSVRGELGRGRGWRVLAMPAMQAVHALPALQARLVGLWFDSGLPPFGWLGAGSWTDYRAAASKSSGQAHHQQGWPGDADARAARKGGLLLAWSGSWGWQPPSSQPSPSREKEKNGALEGGCRIRAGWFDTVLRGLRTGSPRTVSRVASTGRRAGHRPARTKDGDGDEDGGRREGEIPRGTVGMTVGWFDTTLRKTTGRLTTNGGTDWAFARMDGLTAWRAEAWARGWDAGFS